MNVVYLSDAEYKEWQDKKKARQTTTVADRQQ